MQARVSGRAGMHIAPGLLVYCELGTGDAGGLSFTFSVRELFSFAEYLAASCEDEGEENPP